jgi:precorrin-6x reductase
MRIRTALTALALATGGVLAMAGPAVADTEVHLGHSWNAQQCISTSGGNGIAIPVDVLSPEHIEACNNED